MGLDEDIRGGNVDEEGKDQRRKPEGGPTFSSGRRGRTRKQDPGVTSDIPGERESGGSCVPENQRKVLSTVSRAVDRSNTMRTEMHCFNSSLTEWWILNKMRGVRRDSRQDFKEFYSTGKEDMRQRGSSKGRFTVKLNKF